MSTSRMSPQVPVAEAPSRSAWRTEWLRLTIVSAVLATAADATLLERKKGFFTGGFLAVDHLRSVPEATLFIGASLLADAAVVGILVAIGLWCARFVALTRTARSAAILAFALGPLAVANFISYELQTYLGDAFDIGLMFDLTGRRTEEFFAVASSHIGSPLALLTAGGLGVVASVWVVNRFGPGAPDRWRVTGGGSAWRWPVAVFVVGLLSTAFLRAGTDVMENGLRRKPAGKVLGRIAEVASDVDRDGYGVISRMNDPDPFDAAVFPYAEDIPGNGIDENGVGGDLPLTTAPVPAPDATIPKWSATPDIVLVVLESFRADAVGATLNGTAVTPVLDALAAGGVSSKLAFSHNGYTAQSRYHLFTGSLNGVVPNTSLIDDFKANGYEVAYFSGQDESFGGEEFAVGFDRADLAYDARVEPQRRYSTFSTAGSLAVPLAVVRERVEAFLSTRRSDRPLLLYVNFHDTHFPYHHAGIEPIVSRTVLPRGQIGPARSAELRETYLNTAANVDRAIGAILAAARRDLRQEPAVIVTSDHGESLYDEGFLGHGYVLDDVQTRIPFIVSGLPLSLTEPLGQSDLRERLRTTLASPAVAGARPALTLDTEKRVFQYLGTIQRPRQIGFVTARGRTIYDLANHRAQVRDGEWRNPAAMTGQDDRELRELVHYWERLLAARARGR